MRHYGGFTLIEVLVAIAIMSLVLTGLTSMGVTTIQADTHSRRQSAAVSLAQAKLEDLRVLPRSGGRKPHARLSLFPETASGLHPH